MSNTVAKDNGLSSNLGLTSGRFAEIERAQDITEDYFLGDVQVYSSQDNLEYLSGCFPINSGLLVSKSDITKIMIMTLDVDSLLIDTSCTDRDITINERNLYFGLVSVSNWNPAAEDLFIESLSWLDASIEYQPPVIESFSPSATVEVTQNVDNTFSVTYSDLDNLDEVNVEWKLDSVSVSNADSYVFNQAAGTYELIAIVSDDRHEVSQVWTITSAELVTLTCSVQGGDICTTSETCSVDFLNASDSSSCCQTTCTEPSLSFSAANVCTTIESSIVLDFLNIDSNEEYKISEDIRFSLRVRNNLNADKDFDLKVYLYDYTNNKVVDRLSESLKVKRGQSQIQVFEFKADTDLNSGLNYAVLAVAEDEKCQQEYRKIDLVREDHEIVIESFVTSNENLFCGGNFDLKIDVKNIGIDEEDDVYIKVKSNKLKVGIQTEEFTLEGYEGDDSETKKFSIVIPKMAKSGSYVFSTEVHYNKDEITRENYTINLLACGDESVENTNEVIRLGSNDLEGILLGSVINEETEDVQEGDLESDGGSSVLRNIFMVLLIVFLGVAGFVVYNYSQN